MPSNPTESPIDSKARESKCSSIGSRGKTQIKRPQGAFLSVGGRRGGQLICCPPVSARHASARIVFFNNTVSLLFARHASARVKVTRQTRYNAGDRVCVCVCVCARACMCLRVCLSLSLCPHCITMGLRNRYSKSENKPAASGLMH